MIIFIMPKPVKTQMFRKYLIVPILLLTLTDLAHSSGTLTDSLLVLAGEAEGQERVRLLNQVAKLQLDFQPESSLKYSQMAIDVSGTGKNSLDQAEALLNMGAAWVSLGDMSKAAPYLDEAYDLYSDKLEGAESTGNLCVIAYILMLKGQFERSLEYYQRSLEIAGGKDASGTLPRLTGKGDTYRKMGQFKQSLFPFSGYGG